MERLPVRRTRRARLACAAGALALLGGVAAASLTLAADPVPGPPVCTTSAAPTGVYSVTVCITSPVADSRLRGPALVAGTVATQGAAPSIQRAVFTVDDEYVLSDFAAVPAIVPRTYGFTLDPGRFATGRHEIGMQAVMTDDFSPPPTMLGARISSSQPPTPPRPQWAPTAGTPPAPGAPLVVAAVGDGASGEPSSAAVVDLVASWNPNLFLYLGDVYQFGTATEFDNFYGDGDPTLYGRFRAITAPTIGNHEYSIDGDARGYFGYWGQAPAYYSFDAGGWHFVSLDSNSSGGMTPGSAQYDWLAADLARSAGACTLTFFHHPLFNVGEEGSTARLAPVWQLMSRYGVDIVLTGHDHDYQRWPALDPDGLPHPLGTTEFVVGTGGRGLQRPLVTDPRAPVFIRQYGALRLDLTPTGAAFSFRSSADPAMDSGLIPCTPPRTTAPHADPPPPPPPPPPPAPTPTPGIGSTGPPAPGPTTAVPPVPPAPAAFRARLSARRLTARPGRRLLVRVLANRSARASIVLLRGTRVALRTVASVRRGRNAITLRAPTLVGRYRLVLTARAPGAAPAGDRGLLTVAAPRS
ncbi:MAG: large repetitive protein [Miltoncostaeaceae bacterium]|nr:large repetitive protein [Miltoncostaeaceae bacterium]